ncbi:MAG: alpha/beta hydrolase [Bryobacteraceae bacterium]
MRLRGDLLRAGTDLMVIMAHGFTSDRRSRGRFGRLAHSLVEAGYSSFRFDFAGCGESDDDTLTVAKHVDDLQAALAFVQSEGFRYIALYSHSLSGLICLRAYSPQVTTIVLTGAATGAMHYDWNRYFSPAQMRELTGTGQFTVYPEDGARKRIVVEARMLEEFERVDQRELLSRVKCPVLLIHGDEGEEERQLLEGSREGMKYLPESSQLEVIRGANHTMLDHFDRVIALALDWLAEH